MINYINDNCKDDSVINKTNGFLTRKTFNMHAKKKNLRWNLKVEWKDLPAGWILLKGLKYSNPVELSEYATENQIQENTVFNWWV